MTPTLRSSFTLALSCAWKQKKLLALATLLELAFFFLSFRAQFSLFAQAGEHVKAASRIIQAQTAALTEANLHELDTILGQNTELMMHSNAILKYAGLFFLALFALAITLGMLNWFLANRIAGRKVMLVLYATRFAGFTALWFIAGLFLVVFIGLALQQYTKFSPFAVVPPAIANIVTVILFLIVAYFASISYSILPQPALRQTFAIGISNLRTLGLAFLAAALLAVVLFLDASWLFQKQQLLGVLFIILIVLPFLTLLRTFIVTAVTHAKKARA